MSLIWNKQKSPRISVVCPTYNSSDYIERTIISLLDQEAPPYEIIFSDDGSQDDTVGLIEQSRYRFIDAQVPVKILKNTHKGPGKNRNRGILHSNGDWIAFLDADDVWTSGKIQRVLETILKHSEINFIVHWEEYIRLSGRKKILKHGSPYSNKLPLGKQIYRRNAFSTSAVVCKKDLLDHVGGFDNTLMVSQDYELWLKLSTFIRLHVIEEVLGYYIEEEGSITAQPYYRRYWPLIRIFLRHWKKGGFVLLAYCLLKATISKEWYYMFSKIIQGQKGHAVK